jgi:CRP-like cAMP-binding protein
MKKLLVVLCCILALQSCNNGNTGTETVNGFDINWSGNLNKNEQDAIKAMIENMVKVIAGKNRELMQKVDVVSKRTIREKLLAYLSIQALQQDSRYFEIPLGRGELAEYLCVDRSALSRELVKMKDDGLIDYDRNCFRIL